MSEISDSRARLAQRVRQQRRNLRITQEQVRQRGGPSTATLRLIEAGADMELRRGTVEDLERALEWAPGSVQSILEGGVPSVYEFNLDTETVGEPVQDDSVLASLPSDALTGFSDADRAEVITAAKLSALQTAREIRRRLDS